MNVGIDDPGKDVQPGRIDGFLPRRRQIVAEGNDQPAGEADVRAVTFTAYPDASGYACYEYLIVAALAA